MTASRSLPTLMAASVALPSAFIVGLIVYFEGSGSQMLHGAPTGTYSLPSGPKAMNLRP